jgi:hypothetical protein
MIAVLLAWLIVTLDEPVPEIVADPAATEPPVGFACAAKPAHTSALVSAARNPGRPVKHLAIFRGVNPCEISAFVMFFMDGVGRMLTLAKAIRKARRMVRRDYDFAKQEMKYRA